MSSCLIYLFKNKKKKRSYEIFQSYQICKKIRWSHIWTYGLNSKSSISLFLSLSLSLYYFLFNIFFFIKYFKSNEHWFYNTSRRIEHSSLPTPVKFLKRRAAPIVYCEWSVVFSHVSLPGIPISRLWSFDFVTARNRIQFTRWPSDLKV